MSTAPGYIFGAGTGLSYEDLQRRRELVDAVLARKSVPQNLGEGIFALGNGIIQGLEKRDINRQQKAGDATAATDYDAGIRSVYDTAPTAGNGSSAATGAVPDGEISAADPAIYDQFISTVQQGGVNNPNALAAIAATGQAESGYSPSNAYGAWSDPSQSGQAGTAGGIMSWRAERLDGLRSFAQTNGDDPSKPSPATQAQYFLQEDPALIQRLNQAQSVEEAQSLMNNAWKFAGYDQPGGEGARRLGVAQSYLPTFGEQQAAAAPVDPVQVASLDPAAGMSAIPAVQPAPATGRAAIEDVLLAKGTAPAAVQPRESVQRVAQVMSDMPALPDQGVPPEAMEALSNPFLSAAQRRTLEFAIANKQRGQEAVYERQMAIYGDSKAAAKLAEQRQYEEQKAARERETGLVDYRTKQEIDKEFEKPAAPPSDVGEYRFYVEQERAAGREPMDFLNYQTSQKKASATSVNVNNGEGSKFYDKLDEKGAERFDLLSEGGEKGRSRLAQLDQLETLLAQSPSGAEGTVKLLLGDLGVATEGLSGLQATRSLIEKMVPEQRAPGSGPMSDADIAMYRKSLASVGNQPGGNQLILGTAKAIAQYDIQMGEIADRVADRVITPAEGRKQMRELENPLKGYTQKVRDLGPDDASASSEVDADGWQTLSSGVRVRVKK